MKKLIFALTITLAVCTNILNAMEQPDQFTGPRWMDARELVTVYADEYDDLDEAISAIKASSTITKFINQVNTFEKIVNILAAKFKISPINVAKQFETQIADAYITLMEQRKPKEYTGPRWMDARELVTAYANEYYDLTKAINAIKANSTIKSFINQMHTFTKILYILAEKFKMTPFAVAEQFDTPIADRYMDLYTKLEQAVVNSDIEFVQKLIANGADAKANPLLIHIAIDKEPLNAELIKILLVEGKADPLALNKNGETPLEHLTCVHQDSVGYAKISQLINKLIKRSTAKK
jgi:translation initiation factor 2 alpha subunit (eIF-2alpha)